jgi:hypothetical protein
MAVKGDREIWDVEIESLDPALGFPDLDPDATLSLHY